MRSSRAVHGDIATCYCDATKAKEELGWVAERGIEEMCADSWKWQSAIIRMDIVAKLICKILKSQLDKQVGS